MNRLSWQLRDAALGYASRGIPVLPLHHPFPHHGNLQPVPDGHSCHVLRSGRDARVAIRAAASPPSTPSARWCRMGSRTPPVTEPGSWPGGLAIPRPTSAWPRPSLRRWTLTARRRTPSRNSPRPMAWRARGRWSAPAGGWGGTTTWPRPVSATLDPGTRACRLAGRGGYVVAPPSRHASGHPHRWVAGRDPDTPPVQVPAVLFERLQPGQLRRPTPAPVSGRRRRPRRPLRTGGPGRGAGPRRHRSDRPTQPPAVGVDLQPLQPGSHRRPDQREVDQGLLQAAERCGLLAEEPRQLAAPWPPAARSAWPIPAALPSPPAPNAPAPR